jgi:hypothetical protein
MSMSRENGRHRPDHQCRNVSKAHRGNQLGYSWRRRIERNPILWYVGSVCMAFLAGFPFFHEVELAAGVHPVSNTEYETLKKENVTLRLEQTRLTSQRDLLLDELAKAKSTSRNATPRGLPRCHGRCRPQQVIPMASLAAQPKGAASVAASGRHSLGHVTPQPFFATPCWGVAQRHAAIFCEHDTNEAAFIQFPRAQSQTKSIVH